MSTIMFIASIAPQHCLCSSFLLLSQFFQKSDAKMTTLPVILCLMKKRAALILQRQADLKCTEALYRCCMSYGLQEKR
jgi:hypothetical protein